MGTIPQFKIGNCGCGCNGKGVQGRKVGKVFMCAKSYQTMKTLELVDKAKKRNAARNAGQKLRSTASRISDNSPIVNPDKSKSELLKLADKVFGDWIKKRDTVTVYDEELEMDVQAVKCPCCGRYCNVEAKGSDGKSLLHVLHFVSRGIYDLRFDADNCFAGDGYCNLKMHLKPKGVEYQRYRKFLVNKIGETAVAEMEIAHRKINRIEESQLRTVIEHYGNPG